MQNDILTSLTRLSDADLVAQVKSLVARERGLTAQLVAHIAELDTRDVHLREGYESLYVSAGAVNLTAARLLAPHLTAANHREVLDSARGKKKREIEEIVARLSPRPDVAASVRRLPTLRLEALPPAATPVAPGASAMDPAAPAPPAPVPQETGLTAEPLTVPRAAVVPLSPDRYKLQLTIGGETLEKLRLAKDMLSHAIPSGDDAAVLDRALTALLADLARKKFADTPKSRRSRARIRGRVTPRPL